MTRREGAAHVTRTHIALLAFALAALSCAGSTRYVNPSGDLGVVKTVAVLPFENLTQDKLVADRMQKIFTTELLALNAFQIVPNGDVVRAIRATGVDPGALAADDVKRIGQALKADALFAGTVVEFDEGRGGGVPQPVVTLQVRLLDTATAATLWSVSRTSSGATVTARLFGLGGKSASVVAQEIIREELHRLGR